MNKLRKSQSSNSRPAASVDLYNDQGGYYEEEKKEPIAGRESNKQLDAHARISGATSLQDYSRRSNTQAVRAFGFN